MGNLPLFRGKEKTSINLDLVDTPGFPDTNKKNAQKYYDAAIDACKQPLNGIIWLVKQERALHTTMEQYRLLLREFNNAGPPIIMVVNGQENYADEEEREEKIEADRKNAYEFGWQCAGAAGISPSKILISTTKQDLKNVAEEEYLALLAYKPKSSSLKTFGELKKELKDCKTSADRIALEKRALQVALNKKKEAISEERASAQSARNWAWGTWWIPIAGQVGAAVLVLRANNADYHAETLEGELAADKAKMEALSRQDPSKVIQQLDARLEELEIALAGHE